MFCTIFNCFPPKFSLPPFLAFQPSQKSSSPFAISNISVSFLVSTLVVMFSHHLHHLNLVRCTCFPRAWSHSSMVRDAWTGPCQMYQNDTCWLFTQMQGMDSDFVLWDTNLELSYFRTQLQFVEWGCVSQLRLGIGRCAQWGHTSLEGGQGPAFWFVPSTLEQWVLVKGAQETDLGLHLEARITAATAVHLYYFFTLKNGNF